MNIVIETITPAIAEAMLNCNKSNRRLRAGVVEKYASDMIDGRWTNCPEPISFYADGDLGDGQHRLWAIIESRTTQTFAIARGLTREDGLNLNTGLGRSIIDNARISGADTSLSPALISAARAIAFGNTNLGRAVSNSELLEIVERHRDAASFAVSTVRRKHGLCGAVVLGSVGRAYLCEPDTDRLRRFCDVLGSGFYEGDSETAAVTLRNYLTTKGAPASSSALWRDTFLKCQNAIAYFMRGKKLMTIKAVSDEVYPLATAKAARAVRAGKAKAAVVRTQSAHLSA
jgi:hypothetical protein